MPELSRSPRRWRRVVLGLALIWLGWRLAVFYGPETPLKASPALASSVPLENGLVNYASLYNEKRSQGVTLENNALVPLTRAIGASLLSEALDAAFLKELGNAVGPAEAEAFVDWKVHSAEWLKADLARRSESKPSDGEEETAPPTPAQLDAELSSSLRTAWRPDESPCVQAWLERNSGPLGQFEEAARRTKLFAPASEDPLTPLDSGAIRYERLIGLTKAFTSRAAQHVGRQDWVSALDDARSLQQFGAVAGEPQTLTAVFVSLAAINRATDVDQAILSSLPVPQEVLARIRRERSAATLPDLESIVDETIRWSMLDLSQRQALSAPRWSFPTLVGSYRVPPRAIDANAARTEVDRIIDVCLEIQRRPQSFPDFKVQHGAFYGSLYGTSAWWDVVVPQYFVGTRRTIGLLAGRGLWITAAPPIEQMQGRILETRTRVMFSDLGAAIAMFRQREGHFPKRLADLDLQNPNEEPTDAFGGKILFTSSDTEARLASAGRDGRDDEGQGDDILTVVRYRDANGSEL